MADNVTYRDASGATVTLISKDTGAGVQLPAHSINDATTPSQKLTVDSSGRAAVQIAAAAAAIAKAEDVASADADVGVPAMAIRKATPANTSGTDGDYEMLQVSSGRLWTNGIAAGDVAHDGADSGNPVKVGGRARSSEITAVSSDDRSDLLTDLVGKLLVLPYANPELFENGTTAAITDTTSTAVLAAAGAGIRHYVTSVIVTNSHATVGTFVKILDGSSIIWEGYAAAAGGGFCLSFPVPLRGTANTAVNAQAVTTGANFIVSCAGYTGH